MADILLISDDNKLIQKKKKKVSLLRNKDKINTCSFREFREILTKSNYKIILLQDRGEIRQKDIKFIKDSCQTSEIILLTQKSSSNIFESYDLGIYDFITPDEENISMMIKIINCLKKIDCDDTLKNYKNLLYNTGIINAQGYAKIKYLKENFQNIIEDKKALNGVLCLITLAPEVKTKVSINRLSNTISKAVRSNDLIYNDKNGLYYIILKDTNIEGAKLFIEKLQQEMNEEYSLRAGIIKMGIYNFEEIDNLAKNSLQAAISKNNLLCDLSDISYNENGDWLNNEYENKKYKLFLNSYKNKLKNIIEPIFYRYTKEFQNKIKDAKIQQYVNIAESVFCINSNEKQSELIIHFDGFTKLRIQITHKGMDSSENTNKEFQLNKFSEKELTKLLKQLKNEFLKKED